MFDNRIVICTHIQAATRPTERDVLKVENGMVKFAVCIECAHAISDGIDIDDVLSAVCPECVPGFVPVSKSPDGTHIFCSEHQHWYSGPERVN